MKNTIKTLTLAFTFLFLNVACAQTTMRVISDAKQLELNQSEFVGKPLSYLLDHIKVDIKSIKPTPNKNPLEVNRISFLFVPYDKYRTSPKEFKDKPTRIVVVFNQNWNLIGDRCKFNIKGCTEWTKEDENNLGDLIVYRITVIGRDWHEKQY